MKITKRIVAAIFILAAVLWHNGCKSSGDKSLIKEHLKKDALTAADSMEVSQVPSDSSLIKSNERISELENRLENLISVVEQKEKALLSRENQLSELDLSLGKKAEILNEKELAVRRLEIMSWIVLVIGLLGISAGFVVVRHYFNKQASLDPKVEANEPVKSEIMEETKAAAVAQKPVQTKKPQGSPAKPKPEAIAGKAEVEMQPKTESKLKPKTGAKPKTKSVAKPKSGTKPKDQSNPKTRIRKTTTSTKKKSTDE